MIDLTTQLDGCGALRGPRLGAMDRDLEIHRLSSRLQLLFGYRTDLGPGRMINTDGAAIYPARSD